MRAMMARSQLLRLGQFRFDHAPPLLQSFHLAFRRGDNLLRERAHSGAARPEDLGLIKSFCLSLHRSMMAQRLPPLNEGERAFEDELRFV
jgi:hypothetical protein